MKKYILSILLICAALLGLSQVPVAGTIVPYHETDVYSLMGTEHIQGAPKNVKSMEDLDSIPFQRLELGMLASVQEEGYGIYQLTTLTGTDSAYNAEWTSFNMDISFNGARTVSREGLPVTGNTIGGTTTKEFLENLFFPAVGPVANLSYSGVYLEYGDPDVDKVLTWAATKRTRSITSVVVDGETQPLANIGGNESGTHQIELTQNQTNTFTMVTSDGTLTDSDNVSFYYRNRYYWGTTPDIVGITDTQIKALPNKDLDTNKEKEFNGIDGGGDYLIFAFPQSWGEPEFVVNNLPNDAFTKVRDNNFFNQHFYPVPYQVWVSNSKYNKPAQLFKIN